MTPPAAASEQELAARMTLAREFLEVIEFEKTLRDSLDAAMPIVVQRYFPTLSERELKEMSSLVGSAVEEVMAEYKEKVVGIHADLFTEAELRAMLTFYRTPEGRSINAKTPLVAAREQELISELAPKVTEAIRIRGCERFGCGETPPKV